MFVRPIYLLLIVPLSALACRKEVDFLNPPAIYYTEPLTFAVKEVNDHCIDYQGRKAVKIQCINFPEGQEHYYRNRYGGIDFFTTTIPENMKKVNSVFEGIIVDYVDWQEIMRCSISGRQINLDRVAEVW